MNTIHEFRNAYQNFFEGARQAYRESNSIAAFEKGCICLNAFTEEVADIRSDQTFQRSIQQVDDAMESHLRESLNAPK